uniref:Class I SAM-dependent methyltransferase n=1 Tax=Haptolina brevifila TaxID=156173 RepID=A0A7S2D2S4_9EUKA
MASADVTERYQTGYLREFQVRRMLKLARLPGMRTYCEIGMNGGHSTVAMLEANENLTVHSWDLMKFKYSRPVIDLLHMRFGSRVVFHAGDTRDTLAPGRVNATCDLILIDGDHTFEGAKRDMRRMRAYATRESVVVIDDIAMPPGDALEHLVRHGTLRRVEQWGPYNAPSPRNPCMRTPGPDECKKGKRPWLAHQCRPTFCVRWGFAVAVYNTSQYQPGGHGTYRT